MGNVYRTETISSAKGNKFKMELAYDDIGGMPWGEDVRYGRVSEWTTRDKRPGEVLLCIDGRSKRYYDMQGAVKLARREWVSKDSENTLGQNAVKAAQADFEHLRAWCDGNWWYACLHVVMLDDEGEELDGYDEYLGGVEDGYAKKFACYVMDCAQELAGQIETRYLSDKSKEETSLLFSIRGDALFQAGVI
jgi:hypothetical protein